MNKLFFSICGLSLASAVLFAEQNPQKHVREVYLVKPSSSIDSDVDDGTELEGEDDDDGEDDGYVVDATTNPVTTNSIE